MKILHLLESNHFSGAENVACQIIAMMQDEPDLHMAYCSRDGQIRQALEEKGIDFYPLTRLSVSEVKKAVAQYKPDVIHAHDMRASFVAALAAPGVKIISHVHNSDFKSRKVSVKSVLYLLSNLRISHIIWVSNSCYKGYVFHRCLAKKSTIMYNVLDLARTEASVAADTQQYDYDIVYLGRLADPKNPQRLIRILSRVRQEKPDFKAGIAGTGDLEQITKELASEAGLENNIVFHGFVENPMKMLKSSGVMVMTSDREGTPMVALEAMALGVPIVSTPTDGLCDLIQPGVTGYLEWDEDAFAQHVLELISDPAVRARFSKATADEFSRINDIDHYKGVLNEVYCRK